ncbi:hypothetical protein UlMin_030555 [Ulmus minor]
MKGQLDRTKVVLRHLPPTISEAVLVEQIDSVFAGRYNWVSFRPGKNSQKHHAFSRAYLDFKRPEDVVEFAEFFEGHVFVNEKGSQFKTSVEYAPSQRVPKQWSKKDGREGTIDNDPDYLEFLEVLAKPVENLPSAEIQLERREAERAVLGAGKESPIITPLMDFVRQKRAAKGGSRRSLSNGKLSRKSAGSPNSALSKRGSERRKNSTAMYVLRDAAKNTSVKDKSKYVLLAKRDDRLLSDKSTLSSVAGTDVLGESGNKKVMLLPGKVRENSHNQRREGSGGRIIKSILLNKDARHTQSSGAHSDLHSQTPNREKDRRHPRPQHVQLVLKDSNGVPDYKAVGSDVHGFFSEKQERRAKNKDRPDRGVWAPRNRSDGSFANDESLSSTASQPARFLKSLEGSVGNMKLETRNGLSGEVKTLGSGSSSHTSSDNGFQKHLGRHGSTTNVKDADALSVTSEGKSKRGVSSGYGSHEKQVWVQKSSSGS